MSDQAPDTNGTGKSTLTVVRERLRQAKRERQQYEADWFLNLAFFQGRQWVAWDGKGIYEPRINRVKVTLNQFQPIIRTEVAKMTKERPGWQATPRQPSEEAVNDAVTGSRLIDWGYDHLDFGTARRNGVQWSRLCSAGFVKVVWNPDATGSGTDVLVGAAGEPIVDPSTGRVARPGQFPEIDAIPDVKVKRIGEGDLELIVRAPFDIYPDPLATGMNDLRWLIDESVRAPEYVKDRYGKTVQPDAPSQSGVVESRTLASAGSSNGGEMLGVRVYEMWERPSPSVPDGRHVVWCDGAVLADDPNPYGRIPYFMFTGIEVPGRFWPDSVGTHLRNPQERINKLASQIADNASKFGNPSLLIDALADVKYFGVPGEQIMFNGTTQTAAPTFLQPPQMPPYVLQLQDTFNQALRDISGQYEVSNGTVPAGVTAASAISLLQQQDATRLGPDIEAMEETIGEIGQFVLEQMAKRYSTERIVVIAGEDGVIDIDSFRASAAFCVPDVRVRPFSTFPRSIAARQAAIRDTLNMLLQYGVPLSGAAIARALRDMEVGAVEDIVESYTADQQQIAREHADFLRGGQLLGNPIVDNHPVHIDNHKDLAKSARFKALDPEKQQLLMQHIMWHEQQIPPAMGVPGLPAGAPPVGGPSSPVPTAPSGNPMAPADSAAPPQ
jgi:hypothetical protein